jgi:F0F1-type ATP synthase delta subunit
MKQNKTKLYAKALSEVIFEGKTDENKIISNFVKFLISKGYEGKSLAGQAKEILDLAQDLLLQKQGKRKITFEIARRMTAGHRALLKGFTKEGDIVKEKISPELIAGVKIIINDSKQFDASMQSKLQKIL